MDAFIDKSRDSRGPLPVEESSGACKARRDEEEAARRFREVLAFWRSWKRACNG